MHCSLPFLTKIRVKPPEDRWESHITEILWYFGTAGFFFVTVHVSFPSTSSEVGKGFGSWLARVETLHSPERGWYLGAYSPNSVGHSQIVGQRLHPSRI
jgi:hypothetical protein